MRDHSHRPGRPWTLPGRKPRTCSRPCSDARHALDSSGHNWIPPGRTHQSSTTRHRGGADDDPPRCPRTAPAVTHRHVDICSCATKNTGLHQPVISAPWSSTTSGQQQMPVNQPLAAEASQSLHSSDTPGLHQPGRAFLQPQAVGGQQTTSVQQIPATQPFAAGESQSLHSSVVTGRAFLQPQAVDGPQTTTTPYVGLHQRGQLPLQSLALGGPQPMLIPGNQQARPQSAGSSNNSLGHSQVYFPSPAAPKLAPIVIPYIFIRARVGHLGGPALPLSAVDYWSGN